jgi:hypothetical protein
VNPLATALLGAAGGLAAGFVAQTGVTLCAKAGLGWDAFQAQNGLPFFPTALFMGFFYGVIAAAISRRWQESLIGWAGPFLGIAVPMFALQRVGAWNPGYHGAGAILAAAVWGTVAVLGWRLGGGWLGVAAAVAASLAAYGGQLLVQYAAPGFGQGPWRPGGILPQATVLLDGLLTGALLGLSVALARRHYEKASRA